MKRAYAETYLSDICDLQAKMFELLEDDYLKDVDIKWFINKFMASKARYLLDNGNFVYANMTQDFLIDTFLKKELKGIYKKSTEEKECSFRLYWAGYIYSLYQWTYNVSSAELIKLVPLDRMLNFYYPLHEVSEEIAVKKIHSALSKK